VAIELKAIEQLAADQSSLKAAAGLAKPAKWSGIGMSRDSALIWGECAGSGANPYRVMADLRDLGNKCTCPSRKFPCKHVLGLLWLNAEAIVPFAPADTPAWVSDWLGRRRGGVAKTAGTDAAAKDARAAQLDEPEAIEDPKEVARREAAAAKRSEDTERAILDALDALEQWIGDQLRMGLSAFIDDATARCRRIAARLVDGKAAALAGRSTSCRAACSPFHRATDRAAPSWSSASSCCSRAPFVPRRAMPTQGAPLRPRNHARRCSPIRALCGSTHAGSCWQSRCRRGATGSFRRPPGCSISARPVRASPCCSTALRRGDISGWAAEQDIKLIRSEA
jgi:hypothetical protein